MEQSVHIEQTSCFNWVHSDVVLCLFVWFCLGVLQAQMGGMNMLRGIFL